MEEKYKIIKEFNGKISTSGRYSGQEKNKYWFVENKETKDKERKDNKKSCSERRSDRIAK